MFHNFLYALAPQVLVEKLFVFDYFFIANIAMLRIHRTFLPIFDVNANNLPGLLGKDFKNVPLAKKGKASKTL